jgi:hypothetical protein
MIITGVNLMQITTCVLVTSLLGCLFKRCVLDLDTIGHIIFTTTSEASAHDGKNMALVDFVTAMTDPTHVSAPDTASAWIPNLTFPLDIAVCVPGSEPVRGICTRISGTTFRMTNLTGVPLQIPANTSIVGFVSMDVSVTDDTSCPKAPDLYVPQNREEANAFITRFLQTEQTRKELAMRKTMRTACRLLQAIDSPGKWTIISISRTLRRQDLDTGAKAEEITLLWIG